jgi:chemotaxis protein methyltransferase CheR
MRRCERRVAMSAFVLTPALFAIFADLIEGTCGLHHAARDRELLRPKLAAQAQEAGYTSLLDYYYRLRYDDPDGVELRALIETLIVRETYFFRELVALEQLVDRHIVPLVSLHGRARVWSAGCSTGEEPCTLAMLLEERGVLDSVAIVATDLSEAAIVRARANRFGRRSLRDGHPVSLASKYLEVRAGTLQVVPRIHDAVRFRTLNLVDDAAIRQLGTFEAILCRNVLIYFRDAQIVAAIERLGDALAADGLLAIGISESLSRFGTSFTCAERGGAFFYERAT